LKAPPENFGDSHHEKVYIIILNWNGWLDTLACVESCCKLTWPNFRILVVDNGSTDGSEKKLRARLQNVKILQSGSNLGFSGGNNLGIRIAIESGAKYVWLLNNDAVVDPDALAALMNAMLREPSAAIAGSKIYFHDDPQRIWSAGGRWRKGGLALRMRGAFQPDQGQFDKPCAIGSVSGCSMLVRIEALTRIGLLKEEYFLYWEDIEWCARAQEAGYKVLFVPESKVWHRGSASTVDGSFLQFYYSTRNGFFFLHEYDPYLLPILVFYSILFILKSLLGGNSMPLRGFCHGLTDYLKEKTGPQTTALNMKITE